MNLQEALQESKVHARSEKAKPGKTIRVYGRLVDWNKYFAECHGKLTLTEAKRWAVKNALTK